MPLQNHLEVPPEELPLVELYIVSASLELVANDRFENTLNIDFSIAYEVSPEEGRGSGLERGRQCVRQITEKVLERQRNGEALTPIYLNGSVQIEATAPQGKNQRLYTEEEATKAGANYEIHDIVNMYLCVSQKLGPYAQHARNVAVKDFEIACSAKSPLQITASGPAERIDREPSKESTKTWSFGADFDKWFQLSDFKCYLSAVGEAMQTRSITEFSLKASHGISDDNTPTGTSNYGLSRAEPLPSGKSTITLDMTIYLHDKTLYEDWQNNETILQCELVATRGAYRFAILFPRLQITQTTPNFDGAGSIQMSLEASWPNSEDELAAIADSFAEERNGMEWPQTSVVGIIVTNKENRNPMRDMEG